GESTRRLVNALVTLAPLGAITLKGRSETVAAYRVVSLERPAGAAATAFVGRDDELRRIMAVYDAAVAAPGTRLVVIVGSPGPGQLAAARGARPPLGGRSLGADGTLRFGRWRYVRAARQGGADVPADRGRHHRRRTGDRDQERDP